MMKKTSAKKKIKRRIDPQVAKKILLGAFFAAVAFVLIALVSLLFPVKKFEMTGDTHYEQEELIDASGIRLGDRLYWLSASKAEQALMEGCPYIKSVNIKRKFPNKICFEVEERVPGWYVQIGEDLYALDYDLKVLLETSKEDSLMERGLTRLVIPELKSAIIGDLPEFAPKDEHLRTETLKIIDSIRTHRIKERLTYLDLSNRFDIKMTVDETYTVNLGDMSDFETKFDMVEEIIETSESIGYIGGEINVINPSAHSFRGYYSEFGSSEE